MGNNFLASKHLKRSAICLIAIFALAIFFAACSKLSGIDTEVLWQIQVVLYLFLSLSSVINLYLAGVWLGK